jgi:PAS domain S-box-containing protein
MNIGVDTAAQASFSMVDESRALLAAIVESSQDAIISRDMQGRITSWNRAAERLFGYRAPEVIGQSIFKLFGPDDRASFYSNQRLLSDGLDLPAYENTAVTRDGRRFLAMVHCSPIVDSQGQLLGVAASVHDASEARRMQEDVRRRKSNLRAIADNATVGISVMQSGRRVFANRTLAGMLGYTIEELLTHHNADVVREDLRTEIVTTYQRQSRGQFDQSTGRTVLVRKDGGEVPVSWTAVPTEWNGLAAVMTFVSDITGQLREQAQTARLEAQVRESQKLDAIGTLAAGIAHDFNNVLSTIIGNTELARADVGEQHPAHESLNEIGKASRRARNLVEQILTFGRRQTREKSALMLAPAVAEAVSMLRATLPASVQVEVHFETGLPAVVADTTQIHQVILNLCTNAWHAMQGRRGRIEIRGERVHLVEAATLTHGSLMSGDHVCLLVRDNGSGMDASTLGKIFDPFFTTKPVGEGTGIGLSVVHGIVREHGGAIDVKSEPGKGTDVRMYFPPSADMPEQEQDPTASPPAAFAADARVLYVDDDEALVWLTTRLLKRAGYQVSGFLKPMQALEKMRSDPGGFDLVVTDFNMPVMNGLEFAREVLALRPDVPFAIASGYVSDDLRAKAAALGVYEVIYKPDTVDDLVAEVKRLLTSRKRTP